MSLFTHARASAVKVARRLIGVRSPISQTDAVARAKAHAVGEGWPWVEPIAVREGVTRFHIRTNVGVRGGSVCMRVSVADGQILFAARSLR